MRCDSNEGIALNIGLYPILSIQASYHNVYVHGPWTAFSVYVVDYCNNNTLQINGEDSNGTCKVTQTK